MVDNYKIIEFFNNCVSSFDFLLSNVLSFCGRPVGNCFCVFFYNVPRALIVCRFCFCLFFSFVGQVRDATVDCPNRGKAASATAKALEELGHVRHTLMFAEGATFESCVQEASTKFYALFRDRVLQLVHNFPEVRVNETACVNVAHALSYVLCVCLLLLLWWC